MNNFIKGMLYANSVRETLLSSFKRNNTVLGKKLAERITVADMLLSNTMLELGIE